MNDFSVYAGLFLRVEKDPRELLEETFKNPDIMIGEWTECAGWVVLPNQEYHREGYFIDNFHVDSYHLFPPRVREIHRDWVMVMRALDAAGIGFTKDQGILVLLEH